VAVKRPTPLKMSVLSAKKQKISRPEVVHVVAALALTQARLFFRSPKESVQAADRAVMGKEPKQGDREGHAGPAFAGRDPQVVSAVTALSTR
jgi:hypothetical protein